MHPTLTNAKRFIAAAVAFSFLLYIVPTTAFIFLSMMAFWAGSISGTRLVVRWWTQRQFLQKATSISDIRQVSYFQSVPISQLETWMLNALESRGLVVLGDPILGRASTQGYAWQNGQKTVLIVQQERPLTENDLRGVYREKNKSQAQTAIVVSPFASAPKNIYPGLKILAGKNLLQFLSSLDPIPPVNVPATNVGNLEHQFCPCGSPQVEHVSRAGEALLMCSRHPDCTVAERASTKARKSNPQLAAPLFKPENPADEMTWS